jgi:methyl-accepting chemotaxis protein
MAAAPLPDGSGAIYSGIDYESFSERTSVDAFDDGFAFILDKNGQLVAYPDADDVALASPIDDLADDNPDEFAGIAKAASDMIAGKTGTMTVMHNDKEYNLYYQPLGNVEGWSIAVGVLASEQLTVFNDLLGNLLIVLAVLAVVGVFAGLALAAMLGGPAALVSHRLSLLAAGDLKTPFERKHSLTSDYQLLFDSMADTIELLQNYVADIDQVLHNFANKNLSAKAEVQYIGDFSPIYDSMHEIKLNLRSII